MARSHTLSTSTTTLLLLLLLESTTAGSEPPPDRPSMDSDRALLQEAVKMGILSSLGLEKEPRPVHKASQQELSRMLDLYWETVKEMEENSSIPLSGTRKSIMSTVIFPVDTVKVLQRRRHPTLSHKGLQWYRALFQKTPNLQNLLTVSQAKLTISRRKLESFSSADRQQQEIKFRLRGMESVSSAAWTHSRMEAGNSSVQDMTLDITPAVQKWMRTADRLLAVDVGMLNGEVVSTNLSVSMEISFVQGRAPQRTRLPRSNNEDDCDARGWCCRKSITVSFKDIGWTDWVVAPEQYTMHFCDGTCPHNYKAGSMHTQVKSRLHQITKGGTPRPCCVPAAYEAMVLMHYDSQSKLKLTPFKDFIVSKCHCA